MKHKRKRLADFQIDKLTNSIENTRTEETFDTEITQLKVRDIKLIHQVDWLFDWKAEIKDKSKEVHKLSTVTNPSVIQGLISIEEKEDHIFMHLVESAGFNKGKDKIYFGVPGNLVAFACKVSKERGYEGFVAFDSKTILVKHYQLTLGAIQLRGQRMYLDDMAAQKLIYRYFKT
ncbi:MAG TPA: hypothetical protein VHW43_08555 [Puia sp.]|nr:hypothetical protein [Puia sp.]